MVIRTRAHARAHASAQAHASTLTIAHARTPIHTHTVRAAHTLLRVLEHAERVLIRLVIPNVQRHHVLRTGWAEGGARPSCPRCLPKVLGHTSLAPADPAPAGDAA